MSKLANRQKIVISKNKIFSIFSYVFVAIIIITIILIKNDIKYFVFNLVQKQSEKYGYILNNINIYGNSYLNSDKVKILFSDKLSKSIFLISLKDIEKQLMKDSWVKSLSLKTQYPSSIIVRIKEKEPIAIFFNNTDHYYIDSFGEKISKVLDIASEELVIVTGNKSLDNVPELINTIKQYNNFTVTSANYIGSRRWDLVINNELVIKLPEEKYDIALDVFNEFFSKVEKFNYSLIEFIDLRLPEKFIVRFYQDGNVNILDDI